MWDLWKSYGRSGSFRQRQCRIQRPVRRARAIHGGECRRHRSKGAIGEFVAPDTEVGGE